MFEALKALDATVAMDDFGTGYSSLAYLQRLPIDVLKIDKSFVSGMMVDPDAVAIVRAVLSLAEALGMSTTAEGIETVELATTLATLGCASGQGYLFRQAARSRLRSNIGNRAAVSPSRIPHNIIARLSQSCPYRGRMIILNRANSSAAGNWLNGPRRQNCGRRPPLARAPPANSRRIIRAAAQRSAEPQS